MFCSDAKSVFFSESGTAAIKFRVMILDSILAVSPTAWALPARR